MNDKTTINNGTSASTLDAVTKTLLEIVSDFKGSFNGAYNIRANGSCAGRMSSKNIHIDSKTDKPGIDIHIAPGTKGETVYIPACVTASDVDDLVYNDFYVGAGADVTIVAGCGVHTDGEGAARHNGIHRFFIEKGAHALYKERHIGNGTNGVKTIDPVTDAVLAEDSLFTMDTIQLGGVDKATRTMTATLASGAKLIVRERILTDGEETAATDFEVTLAGAGAGADIISRSVAKGRSKQHYSSRIIGRDRCAGHSECDAILVDNGTVEAQPSLSALHPDAALIHEAAIGKIAGEQLIKLRTLGLTEEEAEEKIIAGFLK